MKESVLREIKAETPGIIVLSHGGFALEMLSTAEMICGEMENVVAVGIYPGDDLDLYRERLEELIARFPAGAFVLVDIMGGTPFNTIMAIGEKQKLHGIAGANLALLMEVALMRHQYTLEEISRMAEEKIHASICDLGKFQAELQGLS